MLLLPAIAPLSLARVARETSARAAILACPLTAAALPTLVAVPVIAGAGEPFPTLAYFLEPLPRLAAGLYLFFGVMFIGLGWIGWRTPGGRRPLVGPMTRALLLSPTTVLLPTLAWSAGLIVHSSRDVMTIPSSWIHLRVFDWTASCIWLPVIAAMWLVFLLTALQRLREACLLCPCGYDRRGLSGPCPECGAGLEAIE
jgi:hypothetical protein